MFAMIHSDWTYLLRETGQSWANWFNQVDHTHWSNASTCAQLCSKGAAADTSDIFEYCLGHFSSEIRSYLERAPAGTSYRNYLSF